MIDLSNNHIGDEVAKALADALKENSELKMIDLSDNNTGDEGAKALITKVFGILICHSILIFLSYLQLFSIYLSKIY